MTSYRLSIVIFCSGAHRLAVTVTDDDDNGRHTVHMDNLGVHLRHFYLGSRVTGAV